MIMYIMGVVLKVHVRVFTVIAMAAGFQHETPRKFFLSARKHVFWAKDLAKDFNMRPSRKINLGFAKDSRKYFLFAKNGRLQIKEFRTTAIYGLSVHLCVDAMPSASRWKKGVLSGQVMF